MKKARVDGGAKSRKGGRPSGFDPDYCEQAFKFCLLGATDKQLGEFFDVTEQTVNNWKREHPQFFESIKRGRERADSEIASRLFHRAKGYSHQAVKIFADPRTGQEKVVDYTEHYPPDTAAAIFWLKNRRPDLWREKTEVAGTMTVSGMPDEILTRARKVLSEQVRRN